MCEIFASINPNRYEPVTRHIRLNGQSTSIRLEKSFWEIVDQIAASQDMTTGKFISTLHSEILERNGEVVNFTSHLRCAVLIHLGQQSSETAAQ